MKRKAITHESAGAGPISYKLSDLSMKMSPVESIE